MSKLDRYYPDSFYQPFLYTKAAINHFSSKFKDHYRNTSGSRQLQKLVPSITLQKLIQKRTKWDNLLKPVPTQYLAAIGLHQFLLGTFISMDQILYKQKVKHYFYFTEAHIGYRWHVKRYKFGRRLGGQNLLKECRRIIQEEDLSYLCVMNNVFTMNIMQENITYNYKYPTLNLEGDYYKFTLEDHLGEI